MLTPCPQKIFQLHAVNGEHRGYIWKSFNLKNLCDLRVLRGELVGAAFVKILSNLRFLPVFTQILDDTTSTAWGSCDAGITAVQNQPMVCVLPELVRYKFKQFVFDLVDVLTWRDTGSI